MALSAEVPALEDWIPLTEAADLLGLTRQGVHKKASAGELKTLRRVGDRSAVYVVRRSEIEGMVNARAALALSLMEDQDS